MKICSNRNYELIFIKAQDIKKVPVPLRPSLKLEAIMRLKCAAGELHLRWNQIYPSFLKSYEKLRELGFIYSDGVIAPPN